MEILKNELTIMDIKDISLSPKQVIYFKNTNNFTNVKKNRSDWV
jgi:hypothetical protein